MLLTWQTSWGRQKSVESLVAIAEDSSNPALRSLAAVYHCGHIQAVGTGDDVETTATEALAGVKRPTNPTPSSGTPTVAHRPDNARSCRRSHGSGAARSCQPRSAHLAAGVRSHAVVRRRGRGGHRGHGAAARRGRSPSLRRDVVPRTCSWARSCPSSGHPIRRLSSIDALLLSRDAWGASARLSITPPRWNSRRWRHKRVSPTWPPSTSPPPTLSTCE